MNSCSIRFYAELNDFLPREKRQVTASLSFWGQPGVKDLIESLGVPHTEVDLVLVNGESVEFSRKVQDGDRISVYPVFESIDISPVTRVRPEPLREVRFVLDAHLGRLATYLRMLGFDALYESGFSDESLAEASARERRVLLTRDRELLKRKTITHGYFVRGTNPRAQLAEVLDRFDLYRHVRPFSRCLRCNLLLEAVQKEQVIERLPPKVCECFSEFWVCRGCGRVYWEGSHYEHMKQLVGRIQGQG